VPKEQITIYVICTLTSWAVTEMDKKRLGTWETKILRRTYGTVEEQGVWRITTNHEMRELYKDLDKVAGFKKQRME